MPMRLKIAPISRLKLQPTLIEGEAIPDSNT
jgi:hypothetical protein